MDANLHDCMSNEQAGAGGAPSAAPSAAPSSSQVEQQWWTQDWSGHPSLFSSTSAPQQYLVGGQAWPPPSPPDAAAAPGDELDNYSFRAAPAPEPYMMGSPSAPGYNPSALSPRVWPQDNTLASSWSNTFAVPQQTQQPADAAEQQQQQQQQSQQQEQQQQKQQQHRHDAFFTSEPFRDGPSRYGSPAMLADSSASCSLSPVDNQYMVDFSLSPSDSHFVIPDSDFAGSSIGQDGPAKTEGYAATVSGGDDYDVKEEALEESVGDGGGGCPVEDKTTIRPDEPYAQLIYRAFLSRPDHSMTLQEIYQWFRDNTDKGKGKDKETGKESKGWQNSIRHNLSMNKAFVKREKPVDWSLERPPSPDKLKKSSEWILQPWAVTEGVESTTRYRKAEARRARASPSGGGSSASPVRATTRHLTFYPHPVNPGQTIPGKARSGRKGGKAAAIVKSRQMAMRQAALLGGSAGEMPSSSSSSLSSSAVAVVVPSTAATGYDQMPAEAHVHFHQHPQDAYEFPVHGYQPQPYEQRYQQLYEQHQQQLQQHHPHNHHMPQGGMDMHLDSETGRHAVSPADAALAFHQRQHHHHHHHPHQHQHDQPAFEVGGATLSGVQGVYPSERLAEGDEALFTWCAPGYNGNPPPE